MKADGHIFLVGFMGAGKTSVGKLVSEKCGLPYVDMDDEIERISGSLVSEIFADSGEAAFRDLETEALGALASRPRSVVACGGGIVTRPENCPTLNRLGVVVYLVVTAAEALARIGDRSTRPLLSGSAGPLAATSLLAAREALYRSVADIEVDTASRTPDQVADLVIAALGDDHV